jgi:hypothetical protein
MFNNPQMQQRNGLEQLLEGSENLMDVYLDFGHNDYGAAVSVPSCYGEADGGLCHDDDEDDMTSRLLEPPSSTTLAPSTSSSSMLHVPLVKEEGFKEEPLDHVIFFLFKNGGNFNFIIFER